LPYQNFVKVKKEEGVLGGRRQEAIVQNKYFLFPLITVTYSNGVDIS
jgi:hypothetical protein